ncbi:MAG: hypothetical protein GY730_06300 [bacterium]|nr:hypothetical protein [bacterium]
MPKPYTKDITKSELRKRIKKEFLKIKNSEFIKKAKNDDKLKRKKIQHENSESKSFLHKKAAARYHALYTAFFASSEEHTKTIVLISSAGIGLIIYHLNKENTCSSKFLLIGLVAFIISVVISVFVWHFNQNITCHYIEEEDNTGNEAKLEIIKYETKKEINILRILDCCSKLSFVLALLSLIIYSTAKIFF